MPLFPPLTDDERTGIAHTLSWMADSFPTMRRKDELPMRYHVFESIGNGYMPDNAASYATLEEARAHVAQWVESWRDFIAQAVSLNVVDDDEDYTLSTNDPDYAGIEWGTGAYRNCYIEECHDPACELCQEAQDSEATS
jgi:hypothetical protein